MIGTRNKAFNAFITEALQARKRDNLYRTRSIKSGAQATRCIVNGREVLSFCSNDYLGLANHPQIITRLQSSAQHYGVGSGASHLVSGHSTAHHALEEELAEFTGHSRGLLFSTGYMANLAVLSCLTTKHDLLFEDKLNHASLLDAAKLSNARMRRYLHNDMQSLQRLLNDSAAACNWVVSDSVFSMDGDIIKLPEILRLCESHEAMLVIDDAHGFGVLGKNGRGIVSHFNLKPDDSLVQVCTFGKALGNFGACVLASEEIIEAMIQLARPYIYTTALPPAITEATRESLRIIQQESWRQEHLFALIKRFQDGAGELDIPLSKSDTPIQPIIIGDNNRTLELSQSLLANGILVSAIRPPTVPRNSARLRVTLSANHSEADIDLLLDKLHKYYGALR